MTKLERILKHTIGTSGSRYGNAHLRVCVDCGVRIYGLKTVCDDCWKKNHTAVVKDCVVEDAEGRCWQYYAGVCEECLDTAAKLDWEGWRRVRYVSED